MAFSFLLSLILFLCISSPNFLKSQSQTIKSPTLLDTVIKDYTFQSYGHKFGTGKLHKVYLPANFSGIKVYTGRFRCGSLRRYGAKIRNFDLKKGVVLNPCIKRVLIITQNLGSNWSSIYYNSFKLSGYQLISPVLGILAYNAGDNINFSAPFQISINAIKQPIKIDFRNTTVKNPSGISPICASFEQNGTVTLSKQESLDICVSRKQGHFGLVIESPLIPTKKKVISKSKVAMGSSIGAAIGAFLLTLLVIALFVKVKKKARMDELERRAYEEEALQVSMVGHVRAQTAAGTRTVPVLEHEYRKNLLYTR